MEDKTEKPSAQNNPAVACCSQAWDQAYKKARAEGKGTVFSSIDAGQAYRLAMPALDGAAAIREFIACVAHGMLLGAITGPDGARLLYAAQVAHTAFRSPAQKQPGSAA